MRKLIEELEIKLTKDQRKWLELVYEKMINKERFTYRKLRTELFDSIPEDFNPNEIDSRLSNYNACDLTLLGIEYMHPEREMCHKTEQVILGIKQILLQNSENVVVDIEGVHEITKIDLAELDLIFGFIKDFRMTKLSDGSSTDGQYRQKSLRINDDRIFDNYLTFKSIEETIRLELENRENDTNNSNRPLKKRGLIKSRFGSSFGVGGLSNVFEENDDYSEDRNGITCYPIFKSPIPKINESLCFVLMPFKEEWSDEVWLNLIRPAVENMGLSCLRADSTHGLSIIEDIWTSMNQCAFIIADLSNVNPNVMYEMGIVHTIGKPNILITQDISKKPFDVGHLRQYEYEVTPSGVSRFTSKIQEVIKDIYDKNYPSFQFDKN